MRPHGFPPGRRIRRRREFQRVFDTGRRLHGRFLTIIAAPAEGSGSRLGIVASRKLGGAVARNRAKRLIRQLFRTENPPSLPLDLVVIPRPGTGETSLSAFVQDYRSTIKRLRVSK